ncbi:Gfo/Idh/MocA family protein [Caulobacter sp. KR2-114]|uniref:Gfo/Idh/MocA family protein n=1 Tax=Caulobacter sp. KR2-114 TaxID=3400912 RepID=UPI003C0DB813
MAIRFAALGIDHMHIFDHIQGLLAAGAEFAGYAEETTVPAIAKGIARTWPDAPVLTPQQILEDPSIQVVCNAAVPADRAAMAVQAMRHGKDVMCDKPGATTAAQLADLRQAVAETGRIFSICFSERLAVRAAQKAGELVQAGAIGRVVQTLGMGPHRLNRARRPSWFFEPERYGGILVDIASHQIDQFLFYTGSATGEVIASTIGNYGNPDDPGLQDFGQIMLKSDRATGYIRVDWFTPDGLPTWGDGRLTLLGTEGYIELRKYVDIDGRPGGDHLFLVDGQSVRHIDCAGEPLVYFRDFLADVRDRTETAMPQAHVFEVSRLAIEAQDRAQILTPVPPVSGAAE